MLRHRTLNLLLVTLAIGITSAPHPLFAQEHAGGFVTRFTSGGAVDAAFGYQGVRRVFEPNGAAMAAAIDGDNRIIVAGTRDAKFVVTRLSPSGETDRTFGSYGVATKGFAADAEARAVAIDPWGRIIVAGNSGEQFALACFTDAGEDCPFMFGASSKVTTGFPHPAEATAIAIGSDGRIVVGGRVRHFQTGGMNEKFAVARYTSAGGLDSSFGTGGKVIHDVAAPPPTVPPYEKNVEIINGIAIDPNGRIVAAGTFSAQGVSPRFALIRFHGNGLPDAAFGPDATGMTTGFGGCSWAGCFDNAAAMSLVLQPNGKIVVAGWAKPLGAALGDGDVALARFLSDGSRDSTGFGIDGYVVTNLGGWAAAWSVQIAGGRLYVGGFASDTAQAMVARYALSDGTLDSAFGGGAVIVNSCPYPETSPALALVVQTLPCRGTFCAPTYKPVIAGACISYF